MNLGAVMKLAKGAFSPDDLGDLLQTLGMRVNMLPVTLEDAPAALRLTAMAAGRKGASLHRITGAFKSGETLEALIVLVPKTAAKSGDLHSPANRAIVAVN